MNYKIIRYKVNAFKVDKNGEPIELSFIANDFENMVLKYRKMKKANMKNRWQANSLKWKFEGQKDWLSLGE